MENRFDEKYMIRLAKTDDICDIMKFIDTYWKKGHILATDRNFFEYEMVINGNVDFIIARNRADSRIEGILGFLPCSACRERLDLWGVIWKTSDEALPMLGIELKKRLISETGARTELGVGANPNTAVPLLKRVLHYYTAKMKHYYRLADVDEYNIAVIRAKRICKYEDSGTVEVLELKTSEDLKNFFDFSTVEDCIPYKDFWYYKRRFYEHPIYRYSVWGIRENKKKAVMVTKYQECNGKKALRIVDYLGEQSLFSGCGSFLDSQLAVCEYVDFYFDGFDEEYAKRAGMIKRDENDKNIIPDYFYPFEQTNVEIYVDSSNRDIKCTFFKADGDQDRPNIE